MPWLVIVIIAPLMVSASLHHLGPAIAVLAGTGIPLAILGLCSAGLGLRRLKAGEIPSGVALEALGLGSVLILAAMARWAWVNFY